MEGGRDTSQFVSMQRVSEQLKAVLPTPPVVSHAQKRKKEKEKVISFQSWDKIDTLPSTKTSYFSINIFLDGTAYLSPVAMVEGMKGGHSGTTTSDETAGGKSRRKKNNNNTPVPRVFPQSTRLKVQRVRSGTEREKGRTGALILDLLSSS